MISCNITEFSRSHINKSKDAGPVAATAIAMAISIGTFLDIFGWCHIHIVLLVQYFPTSMSLLSACLILQKGIKLLVVFQMLPWTYFQNHGCHSLKCNKSWISFGRHWGELVRQRASKTTSLLCSVMWEPWHWRDRPDGTVEEQCDFNRFHAFFRRFWRAWYAKI